MKDCTCKVPTTSDVHSLTTCVCCGGYIVANAGGSSLPVDEWEEMTAEERKAARKAGVTHLIEYRAR